MSNSPLTKYLRKHGTVRPLEPEEPTREYSGAVVIPCLAESESLPLTLQSLSRCDSASLQKTMIVAVI